MPNTDHRESRHGVEASERPLRAVLFVDYENAYRRAARLFFPGQSKETGHFHPWKLGELICARHNESRRRSSPPLELIETRVYWGHFLPNVKGQHRRSRAQEARFDVWRNPPAKLGVRAANVNVRVIAPPRQLPAAWYPTERERREPVEKEVDTAISVDLLAMAHAGELDVALLFSEDSDQLSLVIEIMDRFRPDDRSSDALQIHLTGWKLPKRKRKRWLDLESEGAEPARTKLSRTMKWDSILRLPNERLPDGCEMPQTHWVGPADYSAAADRRDYRVSQANWDALVDRVERNDVVRVRGFDTDTAGNRVYVEVEDMEASGILGFVQRRELPGGNDAEAENYVGRSFDTVVHRMNPETGRVEFSIRGTAQLELLDALNEGNVRTGRVSGFDERTGTVYVDLGHGVEGSIPKDELFEGKRLDQRIAFPTKAELGVEVIEHDRVHRKIILSSKRRRSEAIARLRNASWVAGRVCELRRDGQGAWVHLGGPVVGFVQITEISDARVNYIEEIALEGTVMPFVVLPESTGETIQLSAKQARGAAESSGWAFDSIGRVSGVPRSVKEGGSGVIGA